MKKGKNVVSAMKAMKVIKRGTKVVGVQRVNKRSLASALVAEIKARSGRKDLGFNKAPEFATKTIHKVAPEQRAGYPVKLTKGAVHPKDWRTKDGKHVDVDFARFGYLPDNWGQGVKATEPNSRTKKKDSGGGILPCYVAPDGKTIFYHKHKAEQYFGRKFSVDDGINGQIRVATLQAEQAVQLARAQIKDCGNCSSYIGADSDASFFKLLTARERKVLPPISDLHFCVISGRRATKLEGIRDIFTVQMQFKDAGVVPTWYVDAESLDDYKRLGLKAVVGGKLTHARNKALEDAAKLGKACAQCSDDVSAWEYREGPNAKSRDDDAQNAAYAATKRYIVTPVAAARFILAKMRGAEGKQPKLGGVYPLSSCSRAMFTDPFSRHAFIIGDFFVADKSKVRFDTNMKLKEDYDFTCSHINTHGSVLRCQRLTLVVKHYSNTGGAVTNRDNKGAEERRNVDILKKKWPGCFRDNPKRKNEVILMANRWKKSAKKAEDWHTGSEYDADDFEGEASTPQSKRQSKTTARKVKNTPLKVKK